MPVSAVEPEAALRRALSDAGAVVRVGAGVVAEHPGVPAFGVGMEMRVADPPAADREDRPVAEVADGERKIRRLRIHGVFLVGTGENQVGILFQKRIRAVKDAARPFRRHVDVRSQAAHGEAVGIGDPFGILRELSEMLRRKINLDLGAERLFDDRQFRAGYLLHPLREFFRREPLRRFRAPADDQFGAGFPVLDQFKRFLRRSRDGGNRQQNSNQIFHCSCSPRNHLQKIRSPAGIAPSKHPASYAPFTSRALPRRSTSGIVPALSSDALSLAGESLFNRHLPLAIPE